MPNFCSNCGSPLREGATFCGKCGSTVYTPPQVPQAVYPQQVQPAAPAMPEYIREHIVPDNGEIGIDLAPPKMEMPEKIGTLTNPIGALFSGLGTALSGPFVMFAHIKALLFTAAYQKWQRE